MKRIKMLFLLLGAILPSSYIVAQSTDRAPLEDARKAIAESNELYWQAFAKNDASLLADRYAEDCWIMPSNAPVICGGPDAVEDFFRAA